MRATYRKCQFKCPNLAQVAIIYGGQFKQVCTPHSYFRGSDVAIHGKEQGIDEPYYDAKSQLLNLMLECAGGDGLVLKISMGNKLYSGPVDADSFRKGFRMAQEMTRHNILNKFGLN